MKRIARRLTLALLMAGVVVAWAVLSLIQPVPPAGAASTTVGCGPDRVARLVAAVRAANTDGSSTVTLTPGCTYELIQPTYTNATTGDSALPLITGQVTIAGNGALITRVDTAIRGDKLPTRLAQVDAGATLVLRDLTVSMYVQGNFFGGALYTSGGTITLINSTLTGNLQRGFVPNLRGGAVYVENGTLTLTNSTVSGNEAYNGRGGGIFVASGTVSLTDSTLSGNKAVSGGGMEVLAGTVTLASSTVSGNTACGHGGGLYLNSGTTTTLTNTTVSGNTAVGECAADASATGAGLVVNGTATLTNTTVSGNLANSPAGGFVGGAGLSATGRTTLTNTIVAGNKSMGFSAIKHENNCLQNGTVMNGGNNLQNQDPGVGDLGPTCGQTIPSADVKLAGDGGMTSGLDLNGGPTRTVALQAGSPAINAGNQAVCGGAAAGNRDQRGFARVATCDIGAFEFGASPAARTLRVTRTGTGSATVTSAPAGIDCGATCQASLPDGATVTLTATPAAGVEFAGWGDACTGTGACSFPMWGDQSVWAAFTASVVSPTVAKAFAPAGVPVNGTSTLTLTLTNPAANPGGLTAVGIADPFPAGLEVAPTPGVSNTCGGTFSPAAGATSIALTGGAIATAGGTCALSVQVRATTAGSKVNTTGAAASAEGGAGGGTATATLNVFGPPTVTKAFSAATAAVNGSSTLTITLTNPAANPGGLTDLGIADSFPAGMAVAAEPGATNTCGGAFAPAAGATSVNLTGGGIATAGGSCAIGVRVTATNPGAKVNTTAAVSSTEGGAGGTATATLNVYAPPTVTKAFAPTTVTLNGTSTLTLTFTNPAANPGGLTGIGIGDPFPAGLDVAATAGATNTCGGTFSPAAGATSVALTGGAIANAGASCAVSVQVRGTTAGAKANTTGTVASSEGGAGGTATATLTVSLPPTLAAAFTPSQIALAGTAVLRFTVTNRDAAGSRTGVAFTNGFPAGLAVAATPGVTNSCGGTFSAAAGATSVSLAGATLAPGASCTIDVTVTGSTAGVKLTTTGAISSAESGAGGTATATLTVVGPPTLAQSFSPASIAKGATAQLGFTVTNPNATVALTGIGFTDTLPAGLTAVTATTSGVCGAGSGLAVDATARTIRLTAGTLAADGRCQFTIAVTSGTEGRYPSTVSAVTSTEGGSTSTPVTATLSVFAPPSVTAAFSPTVAVDNSRLTLSLTNPPKNPGGLTGVGLRVALPAGLKLDPASPAAGNNCGGTFTAAAGATTLTLAGGAIATPGGVCSVAANIVGTAYGTYPVTTEPVGSAEGGTGGTASATLTVFACQGGVCTTSPPPPPGAQSADLSMTATAAPSTAAIGQGFPYVLTVTNLGPDAATGVVLTATLPSGLTVAALTTTHGTCSRGGLVVTCRLGTLGTGGASATVTITSTAAVAGTYRATAAVQATEPDPVAGNNGAAAAVTVK